MVIPLSTYPPWWFRLVFGALFCIDASFLIWLISKFKNKKIAFLGMKGAGKTTCLEGLQALEAKQTDWKAGNPDTTLSGNDITVTVLDAQVRITDTAGAQQLKKNWNETVDNVDWICYFYDLTRLGEKLMTPGIYGETLYYKVVQADLRDLCDICRENNRKLLIIATHADGHYDKTQAEKYQSEMLKECPQLSQHIKCSLKDYVAITAFAKKLEEASRL